jgi:hypothetical protein
MATAPIAAGTMKVCKAVAMVDPLLSGIHAHDFRV